VVVTKLPKSCRSLVRYLPKVKKKSYVVCIKGV
jgi:hypothetical protein